MQFTTNVQLLLDGLNTVAPFRRGRACETDLL